MCAAGLHHPTSAVSGLQLRSGQHGTAWQETESHAAADGPESNTGQRRKQRQLANYYMDESNILKEEQVHARKRPNFYGHQ